MCRCHHGCQHGCTPLLLLSSPATQGFLPNVRQQRAAGYAAAELAQAVQSLLGERRRGGSLWVNSAGSSGHNGCSGRHQFDWRDAMDIVVK